LYDRRRNALDFYGFRPTGGAGYDADFSPRHGEAIGEKRHQRFIRCAVDRRSVKSNSQRTIAHANDLVPRRARLESYAKSYGCPSRLHS